MTDNLNLNLNLNINIFISYCEKTFFIIIIINVIFEILDTSHQCKTLEKPFAL